MNIRIFRNGYLTPLETVIVLAWMSGAVPGAIGFLLAWWLV